MAKKWKKAIATYNGGLSMTFRGYQFKQGRPVTVTNEKTAKALERKRTFAVQNVYLDVEEPKPAAKPVKKKRAAKGEG